MSSEAEIYDATGLKVTPDVRPFVFGIERRDMEGHNTIIFPDEADWLWPKLKAWAEQHGYPAPGFGSQASDSDTKAGQDGR